MSGMIICIIKR